MFCILGLTGLASLARASGSDVFLDYHHTPWSLQQGAPADIWALAQAADGYLWLGTGFGLYRFDGHSFEPVRLAGGQHLLSNNITALTILPDGDVWIGYYFNGVSRLHDGHITHYGSRDGVDDGVAIRLVQDREGVIWLAGAQGLFFFQNGRWHTAGAEIGYPRLSSAWVTCDSHGTLWVADNTTVRYRPAGETHFRSTGVEVPGAAVVAEDPAGGIWVSDHGAGTRPVAAYGAGSAMQILSKSVARGLEGVFVKRLLFRRDGTIWGTDAYNGGVFLARPEMDSLGERYHVEWFHSRDGLTSDNVVPIIEDQEDNIWVGTNMGLNRFRRQGVVMLRGIGGFHPGGYSLLDIRGDAVTIIGGERRLNANRELLQHTLDTRVEARLPESRALFDLPPQWRTQLMFGARLPAPPRGFVAVAVDAAGTPWVSVHKAGILRLEGDHWLPHPQLRQQDALVICAAGGSVWFGYSGSLAIRVDPGGGLSRYTDADGLSVGNITAIHEDDAAVVIAGEQGIALKVGPRFHVLTGEVFNGITGIASSPDGSLWLNGSKGILRMSLASLKKAVLSPEHALDYRLFDAYDGLAGVALQEGLTATAARGADGLLWFSTSQGVAVVDPQHLEHNAIPPHVIVRGVIADDKAYPAAAAVKLPRGTNRVEIDYTATSLSIPERVRFKFRMEGADSEWREAGNRRETFYTNLGPGQYRFHVIAANNDGVWNEEGATLELTIPPTFFQTPAFALLCILGVMLILGSGYLMHMRQLAARMHVRLEERHMERERIARELHDTLLQGSQGLILHMQALLVQLKDDERRKLQMEEAIDQAEALMVEGRDSVHGLRTMAQSRSDLAASLMAVGKELMGEGSPSLRVTVSGSRRPLRLLVQDELYRIGREAILNARRHGEPSSIDVELSFGDHAFQLCVRDDGKGMDPALVRSPPPGHWGLRGMCERAQRIGATLEVHAGSPGGVKVTAVLTAKAAYKPELRRGLAQRVQALIGL